MVSNLHLESQFQRREENNHSDMRFVNRLGGKIYIALCPGKESKGYPTSLKNGALEST